MNVRIGMGVLVMGLVAGLLLADDAKEKRKQGKDKNSAKLVGKYKLVGGERNGMKIPPERMDQVTMQIAESALTTYDKDEKQVYAATYEVDTSKKPWHIVMVATMTPMDEGKGAKAEGLIEISGDTVRLIYALPGGKPPTNFTTSENQQMFILKKVPN